MEERRKQLYNNLINSGKTYVNESLIGTEDQFMSAISSPEKAGEFYDNLRKYEIFSVKEIGTRDQFINSIAPDFSNADNTKKQDNIFSEEYLEQVAEPSNDFLSKMANPLETPFSQYIDETISGKQKVEIPYLDSWGKVKKAGQEYEKQKEAEKLYRQSIDNETNRVQDEIKKSLDIPEINVAKILSASNYIPEDIYNNVKHDLDAYKNYKAADYLIEETKKTANASKNKSGFWKGVGDNLLTEDAVTLGLSTFRNTQQLKSLLDKVEKEGIQSLTPSENTLLEAASVKSLSDMIYESGLSTLYNVGSATGTSIPYMLQFVITHAPASAIAKPVMKKLTGYVTKRFGEAAIKKAAARAISTLPKVGTKTALKTANALTKNGVAALEAGATGALMPIIQPSMYNDILERRMGQVDADINPQTGKVQYKGQTGEKSWGKSIGEGFTAGAIENLAEMSGGAIMKTLGVPVKALSKVSPKSREFINIISEKPLLRSFNRVREDIAKTTGVHSIPGEALEEFVGQTANALTVGDQKLEDIYTWENVWMTLASVAPLSIGMGSASGVMAQAAKKKVVRDYNRASQKLSEAYSPDLVEYIKSRVGGSPEQQAMIIRQYYDRAREAKNEEEKRNIANEYRLVMDYAAAVNNYDAYIGGIEARVANEVSALSEQIRNDINPDMNATVYIDYDGQMARVTSGNIVFDENGDINDSKSDDTITIELQDGTKQMVSPDKFKVTGYRSFDDQINEATQNIENTILSQEDTDVYGPDPVLDEALYINTDNGPVSVKVTRADYGGFEGIQIDESGKEITEIINGIETPVSIPFSKDQIIRPDNPTIETENNTVAENARPLQAGDVINVTGFQNPVTFVSESNGDAIVGLLDNMGNPIINTEGKQVQVPVKSEQIIHSQTQSQEIKEETSDSASPVEEEVIPMRKNKKGEQVKDYVSMPDNMFVEHMINDYGNEAAKEGLKDRKRNIDSLINRLKKRRDKSTNTNEKIDIDDEINDLKSRLQILEELSQNLPNEPNSFKERLNSLSEPVSLEDYILQGIASGEYKFKWGGKNGLSDELGLKSDRERRSRIGILKNDGYTPETLAERIFQEIESGQLPFSVEELEIRNSIIDILNRVHSRKRALEESESLQKEFEDQQIRVQEQNSDVVEELTPEELQETDEAIAELKPIDDIRFRTKETWTPEEKEIIIKAKNNGTYLKAPNSADTNLNPRQWVQVRTKAFKKWFGDWENDSENVSKVVDENGEPMVVYHGTSNKSFFHIFDYNKAGTGNDKGLYSRGFYFSPNKRTADAYRGKEGHVYGVYLQLKNPFYINKFKNINELADYLNVSETIFYEHSHGFTVSPSFAGTLTSSIKEKGHDGVIVIRKNSDIIQEIVAFNPNQIKSATDNTGEFSINNNDISFRTNMSSESENLQSPDNITLNNEDNSLSSQNDQKEKNGTISESIPQRKYGTQASQDRRMEEAASGLRNRIEASTRDAQKNSGTLSKRQQQEIEQRSAESYAKETGQWIPISDTFTWQPMPSGNENDVYLNTNDGHVYKVNNLINSKGIIPLFDRLILHNQTFPESKYEFVGFTGFDNGNIFPVFRQQYVNNATFATPQEIGEYMQSLGFKQTGDAKYSNGDITISDLRPRNVLKDSDGDLYVVDAEFKAENNSRFRFIGEEGAANLDRSEEATTRLDNLNVAREMENAFEEKKARIEKLRNSEPVEITGNEITPSEDLKQYKKNALEYGKKLQGEYTNKDTGRTIQLQRGRKNGGIKEVLSHDTLNDTAQIKSIAAIPSIIENAIYIDSSENQDTHKNPNVVSYHYYICGLKIGGEDYTVRMVEAEEKDGSRYYDHRLTHIEKGKLINELALINSSSSTELSSTPDAEAEDRNRPTNRGEIQTAPISNIKDTRLISLLQTNDQENARKIKLATGWERGADGKWQYDTEAKLQIPKEEKINEIKRLSDILNTEVEIYDTQADLPTNIREKANGEISGYYMPGNDKVAIVLDANTSIGDIQATMLHEIVGHKGIRGLFGNRTDEFLDKVFESMDANVRAEYMERFNSERLAAEEYLSELAEYNPETSGIKKIIAIIRDFFREILGIDLKLSDNDIVYILSKSRERLQNSRNLSENKPLNESYSPNEESNLTETNRIFNDRLSELTEQNSDNIVLDLGNPSEILLSAGIEDKPMKLYGNKVIKKMKKHGFKLEELRNLPEAVANPIAVFEGSVPNSHAILTELKTNGENILATISIGKGSDIDFNIITSAYGKDGGNIQKWINEGKGLYFNKEKALDYLRIPAPIAGAQDSQGLFDIANIVKEFENPTIPNKNEAVEKRIQQETEETLYRLKSPVKVDVSGDSAIEAAEKISGAQYLQRVIDKDIYRNISYNTLNRNAIQAVGYGRKKLRYFDKRKMENAYKGLFDNMNDLHNLQKTIIDTYGSIDDSLNAYYAENASSSRAQDRTNRFQVEYEQPLINTLAKIRKKFNNDDFMMKYYPSVRTIIERQKVITDREIKKAQNDPKIKDDRQSLFAAIQLAEKKDYAGQTGTYKEILAHEYPEFKFPANFETMTYDEVKDFAKENNLISMEDFVERSENILGNDLVNEFWNNIRKISQYKLYNDYQTGMISRDMFEELTYGVTMKELAKKRLDAGEIKQEQYELVLNTFNRPEALLSRGIITENQYNSLKPRYEYYLPLKGTSEIEADEINEYNNKKVKNISALKAVEGHENVARDPLPQLLQDVYGSIMSQEQNRWRNTLLNMLRKYPMPDLYHIQTEYFTPIRNDKGNIIEYVPYVKIVNDKLIFVPTDEELKAKTAIRKRKGLDLDIEINKRQSSEHAVTFLENGDYVTVYFTDPRIAQSINNLNVAKSYGWFLDSIMKWGGRINRRMAKLMTTYSPEFVISNIVRDYQEASANLMIKEGLKYTRTFESYYFNPELGAAIRRRLNGKKGDTEIDKYVDEFFKYGGETAYNMLPGYEQKRKELYKEIKKANKEGNKAILVGSKVVDWASENIDMLTKQIELRARIATYITSRKHAKRAISRSIWDAKEVTVNFDKRGSWAKGFGFYQLFWNAGRQSNRMQIQMIKTHPIKWAIVKSVNTAIGFAETVLPWLLLGDDDRNKYVEKYFSITPYTRYSNYCFLVNDELVAIPVPPAFTPSRTLGVCMAEMVLRGGDPGFDPTALVIDVANAGASEWLPDFVVDPIFDIANDKDFAVSTVLPQQIRPFAEIYDNRNFFGSPIYNDNINEFKPAYQRIYNGTGPTYVNIAQFLNNWSGGDEVKKGEINLNPAMLEHLVESYASGLGKFCEKFVTTSRGKAESSKDIPVLGRFWRGDIKYYLNRDEKNTYHKLLDQAKEYKYLRDGYSAKGDEEKLNEVLREAELYEPILMIQPMIQEVQSLLKKDPDNEELKNEYDNIIEQINNISEEYYNKKFNQ